MRSASRTSVRWWAVVLLALAGGGAMPASAATLMQPVPRHEAADPVSQQANLLARLYGGRAYALLGPSALPPGLTARDLLVARRVDPDTLRPGDLVAVRTSGDPAPLVTEPVSLVRFVRMEACGEGCTSAATATLDGNALHRVPRGAIAGRVVFALDRESGALRELGDAGAPSPTTIVDAYNRWRPEWTAGAVEKRLTEMGRPPRPAPRRIYTLDVLERPRLQSGTPVDALRR